MRCIISYRAEDISCGVAHYGVREAYTSHSTSDPFIELLGSYSAQRFICTECVLRPGFSLGLLHRFVIRSHRRSVSRSVIWMYSPTTVPTTSLEKLPMSVCMPVENI